MRKLVLGITLGFLTATLAAPNADALVMCAKLKKSTGEVREGTAIKLRTACKDTEEQLDPASLGLGGGGPVLRDADGLLVGTIHPGDGSRSGVVIQQDGRLLHATIPNSSTSPLFGTATGVGASHLWYQDVACSTTPYILVQSNDLLEVTAASIIDATGNVEVYYPTVERSSLSLIRRKRLSDGACLSDTATGVFAEALGPLTFRPPFAVVSQ